MTVQLTPFGRIHSPSRDSSTAFGCSSFYSSTLGRGFSVGGRQTGPSGPGPRSSRSFSRQSSSFALASLVFPRETGEVDLNTYFIENRRPFFGLLAFLCVAVLVGPFVFYDPEAIGAVIGAELNATGAALRVLIAVSICGLLAWSSNAKLHLAFAVISLVLALGLVGDPLLVLSA